MEIKNFIENFSNLFEDTDVSYFTPDTEFHKLEEWDSLLALATIAMADEEYQVKLKGTDIQNAKTIGDLFNIINSGLK